jgi:hypothetical protein
MYLYAGDYTPTLPSTKDRINDCGMHWRNEQFYFHPQMYELGRKYLVNGLADLAVEIFIAKQAECFPEMLKIVGRTIAAHMCLIEDENMKETLRTQQYIAYEALVRLKDSDIL